MQWSVVTFTIGGKFGTITQIAFGPAEDIQILSFLDQLHEGSRERRIEIVAVRHTTRPKAWNFEPIPENIDAFLDKLSQESGVISDVDY